MIDYIPRSSKSFYEKRNDELYALVLPFNKFKIGVPQSLSKGMFNYNMFNRLTLHARHIRDFNQFPIPFLCLATDIEIGLADPSKAKNILSWHPMVDFKNGLSFMMHDIGFRE